MFLKGKRAGTVIEHEFSSFGVQIKTFRKRHHLTQQRLAEAIGVHRSTLINWEQGSFLPTSKTMVLELARHLSLDKQETWQFLEASLTALTPYWMVPLPRNPFFTGREEVLGRLHTLLCSKQRAALTHTSALCGLGGVGKTQIALEYAYRHALDYSAVFWIGAETQEQIVSSLLQIAETLALPGRDDKEQRVVEAVQRWLATHSQWLLIWDNVEDLALLNRFVPPVRSGAILLTTRCQTLGTLAQGVDLLPMKREEALVFLVRRSKMLPPEASLTELQQFAQQMPIHYASASELVALLGGLPLALDQAGAYLEATRCGLPVYLELFHSRGALLLQQRGEGTYEHPASVSATFALAIAATVHQHAVVGDLLRVCALLQPDAIPEEFFRQGADSLGGPLAGVCQDELEWNRVVGVACSYSLLAKQPEGHTLSIHRLLQAVLLDAITDSERQMWKKRVIEALGSVFPDVLPVTEYAVWKQCERLVPHALLCLHRGEVGEESLVLASLSYKVAQYLCARGQYARAESLYQRACSIWENLLGTEHPAVIASLNSLAFLYYEQAKYTRAESLFQRALHSGEQALGPDHSEVATSLTGLAMIYQTHDNDRQAVAYYQRALQIREQTLGPDHPEVARTLGSLANLFLRQGKYAQAETLHQRALTIREQKLGPNHPEVATSLNNLAELALWQSKHAQAEPLLQRALSIREQALGRDHPYVATSLNNLADLCREQGNDAEAEPLYQRALTITENNLGPDHPYIATSLNNLAHLYQDQARYKEAEALYQRALRIIEQGMGPEDIDVAISLNNLANLSRDQGEYADAEPLYQRALRLREQKLGPDHLETAQTLHDLALLRQQQGHPSEALFFTERALAIRAQVLGEMHPKTTATRTLYTLLLQKQVDAQEKAFPKLGKEEEPNPYSDLLQEFLNVHCELYPSAFCRSTALWQTYQRWVQEHHERYPLSRTAFAQQLKAHGCRASRTNSARLWRGIALVNSENVTQRDGQ